MSFSDNQYDPADDGRVNVCKLDNYEIVDVLHALGLHAQRYPESEKSLRAVAVRLGGVTNGTDFFERGLRDRLPAPVPTDEKVQARLHQERP